MESNENYLPAIEKDLFEDNLKLSESYYKEVLYQTIKLLMDEYGSNIYNDLTFLLRQLVLVRISFSRFMSNHLFTQNNVTIKFNEVLDPYEALDMFIAFPQCPNYDANIFHKITCDWGFKYGQSISSHTAKLFLSHQRLFVYKTKNIYKYLENACNTKHDLSTTFYTPEQLIEKLTQSINPNINDDFPLEQQLEKMSKPELYKEYFETIYLDLISKLSQEDQTKLSDLLGCLNRLNEFAFDKTISSINQTINKQIQEKFGEHNQANLVLKMKYINTCIKPINEVQVHGHQVVSSFYHEFNITKKGLK